MASRTRARLATLAAPLALAALLAGCGSSRAGGAGSLTVTATPAAHASTGATSTSAVAATAANRAQPTLVRVALRGTDHTVLVPRGWHAALFADVSGARIEAWSPQRTLLVSSPSLGKVSEVTPAGGGHPASTRTIISGLTEPQGLAFTRQGDHEYLYVAASNALYCYRWNVSPSGGGTPSDRTTTVADLPDLQPSGDDVHRLKDIAVARDGDLFLNVGSSSNATIPAATPRGELPRATVIQVDPHHTPATVRVYATGIRNGEGLAIAPDGSLWTAVNERDQITYPFHGAYDGHADAYGQLIPTYVDNHPPDEVAKLTAGRNLGWPYCDPNPDAGGGRLRYTDLPFVDDQQTNPHGARLDCARLSRLQVGLPAHSAPIGMSFLTDSRLPARWREGAVVAGHGSWDRQPPRPPVVYWMPWIARTHTLGAPVTLVSGFQNPDGTRWGRLADAVAGPDGALYVTNDQAGQVYRFTP